MVGFAVVGLGMGYNRARVIRQTEGAEIKILVDINARRAEAVGDEFGVDWTADLDQALGRKDVDVVLVMTPSGAHANLGVQAAQAGKHVIVTKPMDISTANCDRLIAACDAAGVLCGVDFESRYVDNNFRVAEGLRRGWLGRPILGEARFKWYRSQDYFDSSGWRGTWAMDGGGSLANQGVHLLDLLLWFMGNPTSIYGETAIMNHNIETEDIGLAILNFESGAKGTIMGTTTFPENVYFSAEVHGTEGAVLIDAVLRGEMRVFGDSLEERLMSIDNPLGNIVEDVVSAVTKGTPLRVDGREGRRTVALLETIYASAREGRRLDGLSG